MAHHSSLTPFRRIKCGQLAFQFGLNLAETSLAVRSRLIAYVSIKISNSHRLQLRYCNRSDNA